MRDRASTTSLQASTEPSQRSRMTTTKNAPLVWVPRDARCQMPQPASRNRAETAVPISNAKKGTFPLSTRLDADRVYVLLGVRRSTQPEPQTLKSNSDRDSACRTFLTLIYLFRLRIKASYHRISSSTKVNRRILPHAISFGITVCPCARHGSPGRLSRN